MNSVLTKNQKIITPWKEYKEGGEYYRIRATIRFDDECGNGHNSFAITGDIDREANNNRWVEDSGGCLHDEIAKRFPKYAKYIKWHLCSTDEPMHYIVNTIYYMEQGDIEAARESAIWPEATEDQLKSKEALLARLPALLADFKHNVEELGFVW